ncbi:hypothetical protein BST36_29150 [Mycolicibacterium moriokaense]|uniref:Uncharacterized protein n=1 Tax=Mycolicibacterium moriokaense TaxID=39691 RepID=A0AAD1HBG8_9MYCO|nr:hypothetical protein [Mycolicibacterium moriokaense]MCV7037104.1 hypothetical protein [Mycolicibacterium moriokaense]ORB13809.1 hypothetical protein BST36_29150 [Mycolicibacterium moriokaense]BBX02275.1 hypothetical protein MMOR_32110 [Mycolicibacterium moriokaense]
MTTVTTSDYEVQFEISSGNAGEGAWTLATTVGPQSEAAARHFYEAAIDNPLMRNIKIVRISDAEVLAEHP